MIDIIESSYPLPNQHRFHQLISSQITEWIKICNMLNAHSNSFLPALLHTITPTSQPACSPRINYICLNTCSQHLVIKHNSNQTLNTNVWEIEVQSMSLISWKFWQNQRKIKWLKKKCYKFCLGWNCTGFGSFKCPGFYTEIALHLSFNFYSKYSNLYWKNGFGAWWVRLTWSTS